MTGSCQSETPRHVNAFIDFYNGRRERLPRARHTDAQRLNSDRSDKSGAGRRSGFEFFAPIGDASKGAAARERDIVTLTFSSAGTMQPRSHELHGLRHLGRLGANIGAVGADQRRCPFAKPAR